MQHITYSHWLPLILGTDTDELLQPYQGYDPTIDASIANVFATAALRFGHSLIQPRLERLDESFQSIPEGPLHLRDAFFSPWRLVDEGGVDPLIRGMFATAAKLKLPEQNLNVELTEQLFRTAHAVALDLAAMNVQRSRDHAIPGYLSWRQYCNMSHVETFEDLANEISDRKVRQKLRELYGHPGNIDVWVGGILEDQLPNAKVGPLFRCLLVEQFKRMRDGDRFWYENPSSFPPEQLAQIKQVTLARILCDNGDNVSRIQPDVFLLPNDNNPLGACNGIPTVDLRIWSDCCENCENRGNTVSRFKRHSAAKYSATNNLQQNDILDESNDCNDLKCFKQLLIESDMKTKKLTEQVGEISRRLEELMLRLEEVQKSK
ncbi:peroxidasin [Cephus cinctus]|nr:peroxidasin [Cephus cinctus]